MDVRDPQDRVWGRRWVGGGTDARERGGGPRYRPPVLTAVKGSLDHTGFGPWPVDRGKGIAKVVQFSQWSVARVWL